MRTTTGVLSLVGLLISSCSAFVLPSSSAARAPTRRLLTVMANSFYDIVEKDASGKDVKFSQFKNKVVLGCNVASRCGYTASNYALFKKLNDIDGLEVLLFPCNQFGAQEPGSDAEVQQFCVAKGATKAKVFTKADVNGPNTRPTYKYVKTATKMGDIGWNFKGKFLVDKQGNVKAVTNEGSLEKDIKDLLAK